MVDRLENLANPVNGDSIYRGSLDVLAKVGVIVPKEPGRRNQNPFENSEVIEDVLYPIKNDSITIQEEMGGIGGIEIVHTEIIPQIPERSVLEEFRKLRRRLDK